MPVVIGLDVATQTGIAVGAPGNKPLCWSESLGKDRPHEQRFAQALQLTNRLIKKFDPVLIMIEAPIKSPHDKTNTNMILMGLIGCIRGLAHTRNIPSRMVEIQTLDKYFLGVAGMRSAERKRAIMHRCEQLAYKVGDQDAADAAAVWDFACSTLSRSHSIATTPLPLR